jgi:hypothetical protein
MCVRACVLACVRVRACVCSSKPSLSLSQALLSFNLDARSHVRQHAVSRWPLDRSPSVCPRLSVARGQRQRHRHR